MDNDKREKFIEPKIQDNENKYENKIISKSVEDKYPYLERILGIGD